MHLEVVASTGLVIRISFSNLFKEFKSTSTWLQFPYKLGTDDGGAGDESKGMRGVHKSSRWTFVSLNLKEILSKYLFCSYSYLRNVKLCANMMVKNAFTSDCEYSPLAPQSQEGFPQQLPREMAFPLAKDGSFLEAYDYICFPCKEDGRVKMTLHDGLRPQLKGMKSEMVLFSGSEQDDQMIKLKKPASHATGGHFNVTKHSDYIASHMTEGRKLADHHIESRRIGMAITKDSCRRINISDASEADQSSQGNLLDRQKMYEVHPEDEGVIHVYAEEGAEITFHRDRIRKRIKKSYPTVSQGFMNNESSI